MAERRVALLQLGHELGRVEAARVAAVQLAVEGGKVTAQARAHLTGQADPVSSGMAHGSVLHVTLVEKGGIAPVPPPVKAPELLHGAVAALDADQTRLVSGRDADARAYLLLRPYLNRAVRVEITDPADPTPYWLVSSRHPEALAAALGAAAPTR